MKESVVLCQDCKKCGRYNYDKDWELVCVGAEESAKEYESVIRPSLFGLKKVKKETWASRHSSIQSTRIDIYKCKRCGTPHSFKVWISY